MRESKLARPLLTVLLCVVSISAQTSVSDSSVISQLKNDIIIVEQRNDGKFVCLRDTLYKNVGAELLKGVNYEKSDSLVVNLIESNKSLLGTIETLRDTDDSLKVYSDSLTLSLEGQVADEKVKHSRTRWLYGLTAVAVLLASLAF